MLKEQGPSIPAPAGTGLGVPEGRQGPGVTPGGLAQRRLANSQNWMTSDGQAASWSHVRLAGLARTQASRLTRKLGAAQAWRETATATCPGASQDGVPVGGSWTCLRRRPGESQ